MKKLSQELRQAVKILKSWRLKINSTKTKMIDLTDNPLTSQVSITGEQVERVQSF